MLLSLILWREAESETDDGTQFNDDPLEPRTEGGVESSHLVSSEQPCDSSTRGISGNPQNCSSKELAWNIQIIVVLVDTTPPWPGRRR